MTQDGPTSSKETRLKRPEEVTISCRIINHPIMDSDLVKTTAKLMERVERLLTQQKLRSPRQRTLIALAGVPGSGKTTLSDALIKELRRNGNSDVAVLPMVSVS
jgi:putative protein kinase ArgK-like GTPase of G3E family